MLFFLHIPKTGGSSLNTLLSRIYGDTVYRTPNRIHDMRQLRTADYQCIRGHFQFGLHRDLDVRNPVYLTFVRDPIDRLLSLYHYLGFSRPAGDKYQKEVAALSFADFARSTRPDWMFLDNDMTRRISGLSGPASAQMYETALGNLDSFPLVGLTERFDETVQRWADLLDWPTTEYELTYQQPDRPKRADLAPSLIDEILQRQQYDVALYNHVIARFGWN